MEQDPRQRRDTQPQQPLRDWQKEDTWYGPFPTHENPFDEPEDAPELRELRSDELNNRSGQFWDTWTGGYQFGKTTARPEEKPEPGRKKERSPGKRWAALGMTAAALVLVSLILYYAVFAVRTITVQGNQNIPEAEVIRLSGIRTGMPIFSLSADEIERKIEQNPVLKFRYLEKRLPGTVILSVKEREACCWMTWNGILYTLDKQRVVLSESEDITVRPAGLVRVDGLKIRSGAMVGQQLVLESSGQQEAFSALFLEMKVLGCGEIMEEADLSNLNSLLLTTRDGFTVALGDTRDIHAKLRSMLLTREELLKREYRGGVINVTLPETPIFSPPSL